MPIDIDEWQRWRGTINEKVENHTMKLEDHCERLANVEEKVSQILVKLAVPLFLTSLVGVVLGGVIVFSITNAMKH